MVHNKAPFTFLLDLSFKLNCANSTVKLEVGLYKDGSTRYEIRHIDDLKFAHPDSLAAEARRPALGRRPTSPDDRQKPTEASQPLPSLTAAILAKLVSKPPGSCIFTKK